jgi:hypothetical protein
MSSGLSPENRVRKTDLLANARENYTLLCERIIEFNAVLETARGSVEAALADYAQAAKRLEHFKETMREEQLQALAADGDYPERHGSALDWLELWASFRARLPTVELPTSVAVPGDDLLSYFEELPDCP